LTPLKEGIAMASFNRVILVGNLTRTPKLEYTQGQGTAVTEIGLAVNDRRKSQSGEWIEETTFVDITLWGRTAEVACQYLDKGSPVLVEGRLKLDTWEKEGQKRSKLRVVGERMQMLGGRGGGGGGDSRPAGRRYDESENSAPADNYSNSPSSPSSAPSHGGAAPDDDIPF